MSRQRRVLCGVPREYCTGGKLITDQSLGTNKCHISRGAAFDCRVNHLVNVLGYKQIGSKEFSPPDGGRILVLTKRIRYGGLLRSGKEQTRFMPAGRSNSGIIIG